MIKKIVSTYPQKSMASAQGTREAMLIYHSPCNLPMRAKWKKDTIYWHVKSNIKPIVY